MIRIREVKLREAKAEPVWTCPNCGSHIYSYVVVHLGKHSSGDIGYSRLKLCSLCGYVERLDY